MLKIRKVHMLIRHLFNQKNHSVGIVFLGKDGRLEWLWTIIQETVDLHINDAKEFTKRGGVWTFSTKKGYTKDTTVITNWFRHRIEKKSGNRSIDSV